MQENVNVSQDGTSKMTDAKTALPLLVAKFVNQPPTAQSVIQAINGSLMEKVTAFAVLDFGETGIHAKLVAKKLISALNANKTVLVKYARIKES